MSNFDVNVDGQTNGRTYGRTEIWTPISDPALSRCDKNQQFRFTTRSDINQHVQSKEEKYQITPGPKVIKLFSCLAQLRLKFIPLINVKMPTIVGILTFISRIIHRLW